MFEEIDRSQVPEGAKNAWHSGTIKKPLDTLPEFEEEPSPLGRWNHCGMGSYEAGTVGHNPQNSALNPSVEGVRWGVSCMARCKDWWALISDVSAAFLNATIDEDIYMQPPEFLLRVGLRRPVSMEAPKRAVWPAVGFGRAVGTGSLTTSSSNGREQRVFWTLWILGAGGQSTIGHTDLQLTKTISNKKP